jgi:Xaa-Pro dipeptidase
MARFSVGPEEYVRRQDAARGEAVRLGLDGLTVFAAQRVQYLSGFAHIPTERPVALVLPVEGSPAMLVPKLEEEHLMARVPGLARRRVYPEYPGLVHPMRHLAELLAEMGLAGARLGADTDGYGDVNGYRGPLLSEVTGVPVTIVRGVLDDLRMVKSALELDLLRESGRWATATHRLLQRDMALGQAETAISERAQRQAGEQLAAALAEQGHLGGSATVHASFRSGPRTAMPHAMMGNRAIGPGDNLVSYCLGSVAGYHAEVERTMFVGEPSARQRELFEVVREAQELALSTIKPGVACSEIEARVRPFLVERGYEDYITHHIGHGLGIESHEPPYFDLGDRTILRPGMVFSVEPGLYVPGLGGFRHSDTVALTERGVEVLTEYPRRLEDMIIPA